MRIPPAFTVLNLTTACRLLAGQWTRQTIWRYTPRRDCWHHVGGHLSHFNVDYPANFKGHSLSVSDVVVLHQNGQDTAHYCDSVGFQQVPEFLRENPLRTAELSIEQNENMIDGVLNNAPSLGELEAKAKAGEQISLTDLAAAVKAEEKAPKAKKSRTAKPKKPSIRAQLDAVKKEQSKQTPPREKTKELEV